MKLFKNSILTVAYPVFFIALNLVSIPSILSESKRDHEFILYTFRRPPFNLTGTIDSDENYYYFTNGSPVKCDLKLGNACFMKTKQKATIISPGIIQFGNAYACAESLITKEWKKTEHLPQFRWGYGTCTQQGWVSKKNPYFRNE